MPQPPKRQGPALVRWSSAAAAAAAFTCARAAARGEACARRRFSERWIAAGLIKPIDPKHLFFTIWAATQTYADFSTQIQLLLDKPSLTQEDFDDATQFLCQFVLSALGIKP